MYQFVTYCPEILNGIENVYASRVYYDAEHFFWYVENFNVLKGSESLLIVGLDWHNLPD